MYQPKIDCEGWTKLALVPLGSTFLMIFPSIHLKIQGMNPMGLSAPWGESLEMISGMLARKITRG